MSGRPTGGGSPAAARRSSSSTRLTLVGHPPAPTSCRMNRRKDITFLRFNAETRRAPMPQSPQSHPLPSSLSSSALGRRQVLKAFGLVGATAVAGPAVLSACSSGTAGDAGGAGGAATGGGGPVTGEMDFWWNPSVESADAMGKWMSSTVADFQKANPGTTINSVTQPAEQLVGNFRTACQSQSGPGLDHQY